MISVIIPAHNEEAVIARGLGAIVAGAQPGEIEVIVACNGCTDRTAEIARAFGPPVRVLEIEQASKTAALNAADEVATGFPRFYVDADVVLDRTSIRRMAQLLSAGGALLVAPEARVRGVDAPWLVRAFYRVWTRLPYNRIMVGTGAYALSRAGRARFKRFPDILADDAFVRFSFTAEERMIASGARVYVDLPRTVSGLVKIHTRARVGRRELRSRFPQMTVTDSKPRAVLARFLARHPRLLPEFTVYVTITLLASLRARLQCRHMSDYRWERDDSTRAPLDDGAGKTGALASVRHG